MTTREQIAAALAQAESTVRTLRAALAEIDGAPSSSPPDWVDFAVARKMAGCSSSSLYRWAEKFGIGERLPSGTWRFSRQRLRDFLAGRRAQAGEFGEACGELGDVGPLRARFKRA